LSLFDDTELLDELGKQPAHRESVGTREEPTVIVVHVAATPRLETGTVKRPGERRRQTHACLM
jgi:hypothetical protein